MVNVIGERRKPVEGVLIKEASVGNGGSAPRGNTGEVFRRPARISALGEGGCCICPLALSPTGGGSLGE